MILTSLAILLGVRLLILVLLSICLLTDRRSTDMIAEDGATTAAEGQGFASLVTLGLAEEDDALHVPTFGDTNLLSVSQAVRGGRSMIFTEVGCSLHSETSSIQAEGSLCDGLYVMKPSTLATASMAAPSKFQKTRLHHRLCHRDKDAISVLTNLVDGLWEDSNPKDPCGPCLIGKAKQKPLPKRSLKNVPDLLLSELVSMDVCGKLPVPSLSGAQYFITFIEHRSKMRWTYLLRKKESLPIQKTQGKD